MSLASHNFICLFSDLNKMLFYSYFSLLLLWQLLIEYTLHNVWWHVFCFFLTNFKISQIFLWMFHKIYSLHKTDKHDFLHQHQAGRCRTDFVRQKHDTDEISFPHLFSRWHTHRCGCSCLLVCLRLLVILADLEVSQLVRLLVRGHHPQPVAEVVLLQVLLCQVLQIPVEEHWPSEPFPGRFSGFCGSCDTSRFTFWRTASQTSRWSCSSCGRPGRCHPDSPSSRSPWSSL